MSWDRSQPAVLAGRMSDGVLPLRGLRREAWLQCGVYVRSRGIALTTQQTSVVKV